MDCNGFADNWKALVAETLDDSTKALLGEHARRCRACGEKWDEHYELCATIRSVLSTHSLPPNVADDVARKVHQEHFGTSTSAAVPPPVALPKIIAPTPGLLMLVTVLMGGLVGYMLAGTQSHSSISQQIAFAQLLDGRSGGRIMTEKMMFELMGVHSTGGSGILGTGVPQITSTVRIVFFIALLMWIARTKIWEEMFPSGVPGGITVARWAALLTAILGLARCGMGITLSLWLSSVINNSRGGGRMSELLGKRWLPSLGLLDQMWAIGFWLTLMIVLFTATNQLSLRLVRQSQQGTE